MDPPEVNTKFESTLNPSYLQYRGMPLVHGRIADGLSGCRVSQGPKNSGLGEAFARPPQSITHTMIATHRTGQIVLKLLAGVVFLILVTEPIRLLLASKIFAHAWDLDLHAIGATAVIALDILPAIAFCFPVLFGL